jgi:hypothetical protein
VGSLYENCISKSLLQVNERVKAKVDLQKQSSKVVFNQVQSMRDANQSLKKNLKFIREAIESEYEASKEQNNNLINELGGVMRQNSKESH